MKHAPTLISIAAVLLACAMSMKFRSLPWLVPAYLLAQTIFSIVSFVAIQREALNSVTYLALFGVMFCIVLGIAVGLSVILLSGHAYQLWSILSAFSLCLCVGSVIHKNLALTYGSVPPEITLVIVNGSVLCFCGLLVFISLIVEPEPATKYACIALGSFWSAIGLLAFFYSVGVLGVKQPFYLNLNRFGTAFIACVCFGWLSFMYYGQQAETAQQAIHSDAAPITEAQ